MGADNVRIGASRELCRARSIYYWAGGSRLPPRLPCPQIRKGGFSVPKSKPRARAFRLMREEQKRARFLLPEINRARGFAQERQVVHALSGDDRPEWVYSAEISEEADDRRGVDVIVETDVGKLFLQVKSSHSGVERFNQYRGVRRRPIGVVLIERSDSVDDIRLKATEALAALRAEIFRLRGTFVEEG